MKSITFTFLNIARDIIHRFDELKRWLFFGLFIPITVVFFLMEWDLRALLFIMLGYVAALVGFMFAKTPMGKVLLTRDEELFHRMVAGSTEEILIVHHLHTGRNVFVTPSVKKILGYHPSHIVDRYGTFIIHSEDRNKMEKLLSSVRSNTRLSSQLRVLEKGGKHRWMSVTIRQSQTDLDPKNKYLIWAFRDVQKQKEMEKVSRLYMEELMRKDPTLVLENEVSEQMLGLMTAHEMKEPLRTLQSYVQLLSMRHKVQLSEAGKECLHFVRDSADRLAEIIEDIESLFQIDNRQTVFKKVDTQKLVNGTLKLLRSKIRHKDASVVVGNLPEVMADSGQLRHVFQNLIDNALKYNDGQPNIRISCEERGQFWVFEIKDNGIGVAHKHKEVVFDAFRRLHGPQEYGGGSGIGLAICRKVVENHFGSIWMNSQMEGEGSRFSFSLPVQPRRIHIPKALEN